MDSGLVITFKSLTIYALDEVPSVTMPSSTIQASKQPARAAASLPSTGARSITDLISRLSHRALPCPGPAPEPDCCRTW